MQDWPFDGRGRSCGDLLVFFLQQERGEIKTVSVQTIKIVGWVFADLTQVKRLNHVGLSIGWRNWKGKLEILADVRDMNGYRRSF